MQHRALFLAMTAKRENVIQTERRSTKLDIQFALAFLLTLSKGVKRQKMSHQILSKISSKSSLSFNFVDARQKDDLGQYHKTFMVVIISVMS